MAGGRLMNRLAILAIKALAAGIRAIASVIPEGRR